jgi:hypothetical protein
MRLINIQQIYVGLSKKFVKNVIRITIFFKNKKNLKGIYRLR